MNICHVWDADYPWDVRVEKVSRSLTEAGHDVHVCARNRARRPTVEKLAECTVHRLRPCALLPAGLDSQLMFPAFFNPRWLRHIRATVIRQSADVLLVRDLPLAPTAIAVGRKLGLPVVLDMAENYPAMIRELWLTGTTKPFDSLVRNPHMVAAVERWVLPRVDHVLVVVEESRERLLQLGVSPERVTVVSNTPPRARALVERTKRGSDSPQLRLIYVGLMERSRGIETVLDAVRLLATRGLTCHVDLVGGGRDLDRFRSHAWRLQLGEDRVRFHGQLSHEKALELLADADIGLIPHHANEFCDTTIPNKLFDYMAAGIASITSSAKPLARIVKETGCGFSFRDRDPEDLARVLAEANEADLAALGQSGRRAVRSSYYWESDAGRLFGVLDRMVRTSASRDPELALSSR